jgi:hypothetical protein
MKRVSIFLLICFFSALSSLAWGNVTEPENITDWKTFSKNLVHALNTENEGLQLSAMQKIIFYGDKLNVNDAVFKVMSFFRDDKNENVRMLALMTLRSMHSNWAMDFLKRAVQFEENPRIKRQICVILHEYNTKKMKTEEQSPEKIMALK